MSNSNVSTASPSITICKIGRNQHDPAVVLTAPIIPGGRIVPNKHFHRIRQISHPSPTRGTLVDILQKIEINQSEGGLHCIESVTLTLNSAVLPGNFNSGDTLHKTDQNGFYEGCSRQYHKHVGFDVSCNPSCKTIEISLKIRVSEERTNYGELFLVFAEFVSRIEAMASATKAITRLIQAERGSDKQHKVSAAHTAYAKLYELSLFMR